MKIIRQAKWTEMDAVAEIYERIIEEEEQGKVTIGWKRDVYPTKATAAAAQEKQELYVLEDEGRIVAAMRLNQEQLPAYRDCQWEYPVADEQVMVMHTLVVDPAAGKHGYGKQMVAFYEQYAADHHCPSLRIDTNEKNVRARALYQQLGYKEVGIVPCTFNGLAGVPLVCLEKMN